MSKIELITADTQTGFYPTPKELAEKLLENIRWYEIQSVLEPSAGKGDLAEMVREPHGISKRDLVLGWHGHEIKDIDCVEIDPNLRAILKDKGFRVVHDDFLTFNTYKRYDLIVMNPPFSDGDRHLLKALSLLKFGGEVRCILNAETIRNPFSAVRKKLLAELTEMDAEITFVENAFMDAERKTDVEVAIVKAVDKREKENNSFIKDRLRPAHRYVEASETGDYNALAKANPIDAIVDKYNYELECGLKLIEEYNALNPRLLTLSWGKDGQNGVNGYIRALRGIYWQMLFENDQITGQLTSKLREKLRNMVDELADYEFSAYNIYELMIHMNGQMTQSISDTIMRLFDDWTRKYHWDENAQNRHYFDGWRTNDAFAVNNKIIIPLYAFSQWKWDNDFEDYRVREHIGDIQKVFDFLDGGRTEDVDVASVVKTVKETGNARNVQFKYFKATFYKKGTCHITFTNPDVLAKFNLFAAQNKHWLPPSFGKKRYKQMDEEERAVVDSFTGGEKAYESMMNRADYFFSSGDQPFLLTSGKEETA